MSIEGIYVCVSLVPGDSINLGRLYFLNLRFLGPQVVRSGTADPREEQSAS